VDRHSDAPVSAEPTSPGGLPDDFLGAFAVVRRGDAILFVANDRRIGGVEVRTWDLPGGQVEGNELLGEALARELAEETGLIVAGAPELLFVQDGERRRCGNRVQAWRSFFFAVEVEAGEPQAGHEVRAVRWLLPAAMKVELTAPYHGSFLEWLERGGTLFHCTWND